MNTLLCNTEVKEKFHKRNYKIFLMLRDAPPQPFPGKIVELKPNKYIN